MDEGRRRGERMPTMVTQGQVGAGWGSAGQAPLWIDQAEMVVKAEVQAFVEVGLVAVGQAACRPTLKKRWTSDRGG